MQRDIVRAPACHAAFNTSEQHTSHFAQDNDLQVRLTTGRQAGRIVALPRMSCHVSKENSGLPFDFARVQFPLIPAYCVSVHKSQGQTLERIGIVVDQDSFAHGQLYTAFSRTSGWFNISVFVTSGDDFVTNLVHRNYL